MVDIATLGLRVESSSVAGAVRSLDGLTAAAGRAERSVEALGGASKGADAATREIGRAAQRSTSAGEQLAAAINKAVAANDNLSRAGGLARHEMINLSRQIQDIGVSLASGQSPFTVLVQQGTQIADVFAASNATVRGFASQVLGMVTPVRVGIAGLAVGVVGTAVAMNSWAADQREVQRQLAGTGRDAGLTATRVNEIADAVARAQNISRSSARATVGSLANAGTIDPAYLQRIAAISKDLAATLAVDLTDATSLLRDAFSDPVRGAELLNEKLGGLTNRTRDYIREQVSAGREGAAYTAMLDTFSPRLVRAADQTSIWAKAWEALSRNASNAMDAVGEATTRAVQGPPSRSFAQQAQDRLDALEAKAQGQIVDRTNGRLLGSLNPFGALQDDLQREETARKRVTAELELQRLAVNAIRIGQDALNSAVERQAQAAGEAARQRRAIDTGTSTATAIGVPDQLQLTGITRLAEAYRELYRAKEAAYQNQSQEGGFETYRRAQENMVSAQRALREAVSSSNGMFARDGQLLLDNNQIIQRRVTLQDQVNQRTAVDRQSLTAVTVAQRTAAAAERERQQAREQGVAAGSQELVNARAQAAAGTEQLSIQHQLSQAALERIRSTRLQIETIRAETAAIGGSVAEQERVRTEQQLITAAKAEYMRLGLSVPPAEIAAYRELAKAMGEARQQQAELRAQKDLSFERGIIGLSDTEQTIARNLRQIYGDDNWRSQMNGALAQQARFNDQLKQSVDLGKGFGSDLLSGLREGKSGFEALLSAATKFNDKLANMAMDRFMGAVMSGQDPFAAMFSNGRGGSSGGGAGGVFSMSPTRFFNSIQNAVSGGTNDGLTSFSGTSQGGGLEGGGGGSSFGSMAGGGIMAGGALLGAYGAGKQGGALYGGISGALSGAMAGSMILPGIGTVVGAITGALAGVLGGSGGSSERNKARDEWRLGEPERKLWVSQLKGEVKGSLATTFATEEQKVLKLSQDAWFARQDPSVWKEYSDSFGQFRINNSKRFMEPFEQMLAALEAGLGSNSPVAQAHSAVASLREEMLKFVSDAATAAQYLDRDVAAYTTEAQQAAQAYALSLLTGAEEQTKVRQEFDRINQTAISLQTVLVDLGMSAEGAATAIQSKLTQALDKLRADTEEDLNRRYRTAIGGGYINDVIDAFKRWEDDLKDASTLGIGSDIIDRTNIAEIQKIVTGAKLTQDAFDDLIAGFPKLEGAVRRAASTLEEIAERRLGYLDRYFAATNDTSTLEGQLTAFERSAARDRENEIKAGGEAMAELEAALAVERLKIVQDYGKQQQKVLEQAQEAYLSFVRRIREYTDGLRAGAQSPLSPEARLAAAQSQYNAQLGLAQGGNRDALNGITSYASDLLEAAKAYYASSTAYQAIWSATVGQLEALPNQVSAEQFIVNAINSTSAAQISALDVMKTTLTAAVNSGSAVATASALSSYFSMLDSTMDQAISLAEMQQALGLSNSSSALKAMFDKLDGNGNGLITQAELKGALAGDIKSASEQTKTNTANTKSSVDSARTDIGYSNQLLEYVRSSSVSTAQALGVHAQIANDTNANLERLTAMRLMMRVQNQNWGKEVYLPSYGAGGWIGGNLHSAGGTIIEAERGEYVISRMAAQALRPWMETINQGRLPVMPVPYAAGNDNGSMRALLAEIAALRAEVKALRGDTRQGAVLVAEEVSAHREVDEKRLAVEQVASRDARRETSSALASRKSA